MAWEREFEVLEEAIRRLNVEYDAFLYGSSSRPPGESRKHVEEMFRRLSQVSFEAAADRYRFSTLQGRYTALGERWERLQTEKESGRRPGLYGHFTPGPPPGSRQQAHPDSLSAPNAASARSVEARGGDSRAERQLYEKYLAARSARGESVEGYSLEKFSEAVVRERAKVRERLGTDDFDFDVAERDGRVKLVARRVDKGSGGKA